MNYLKDIARLIELKDDDSLKDCLRDGKLMLAKQIPIKRPQDIVRMMKKDSSAAAYIPSLRRATRGGVLGVQTPALLSKGQNCPFQGKIL